MITQVLVVLYSAIHNLSKTRSMAYFRMLSKRVNCHECTLITINIVTNFNSDPIMGIGTYYRRSNVPYGLCGTQLHALVISAQS